MRRAFVMGSNGPTNNDLNPLQYARQDAEHIKACLSGARCGFVVDMPTSGADAFEVRRQLTSVAESCTSEDTFVCYFSGHGILEKGALFLLWENTQLDRLLSTALPVSEIMQVLKYCKASSRLLILDCCHAGTVATMLGLKDAAGVPVQELDISPDNYFVLMASDRLEMARELETLKGSFLTADIAEALEGNFSVADKDKDGRLSMQDLQQWLEGRAKIHNRLYPSTRVSYPYLLGKQKGEFYLTLAASTWVPYEIPWPDDSTMVVLPIRPTTIARLRLGDGWGTSHSIPSKNKALCISKYPITNAQYKMFVEEHRPGIEPFGEHYISKPAETTQYTASQQKSTGSWQEGFYPWHTEEFRDPEKPVVCVSFQEAISYCSWVNTLGAYATGLSSDTFLPSSGMWDFAAFGTTFPSYDPDTIFTQNKKIHHKSSAPAPIDHTGARSNTLGISDLLGNVWEWCYPEGSTAVLGASPEAELRGGGFLDDLSKVKPILSVHNLRGGTYTKHFDLGFRIAAAISFEDLPEEVRQRLLLSTLTGY